MKKNLLIIFALLSFKIVSIHGQANNLNTDAKQKLNNLNQQYFIENKGQWPNEVLYLTQMRGLNTWITTKGIQLEFYKKEINNIH